MSITRYVSVFLCACALVSTAACGQLPNTAVDSDPAPALTPPASMEEIAIPSDGARINGLLYLAAGAEPRPVVIFLHGYPGNERNLDLAQAVRRAGYQALYVDYRGTWGSGGTFSFAHGLEDVAAVLAWVRTPANATRYQLDVQRIALVGHSFGGWLALLSAAREAPDVCVAAFAAWNVGWAAQRFETHPDERADTLKYLRVTTDPLGGPIRAVADELLQEMTTHATEWDYVLQAESLRDHALLVIGATRDAPDAGVARHAELARAIHDVGGRQVRVVTYEDDHAFSSHRIALAQTLTEWLRHDCARAQTASSLNTSGESDQGR